MTLTSKEAKRLKEIEKKALQNFIENADFYTADWVDDEDIEEYFILTEKQ